MIQIAAEPFESYTQQVTLNNVRFTFGLTWNSRGEFWSLDVLDENSVPIVAGIPLVCGRNLFTPYPDIGLPGGELAAIDTLKTGAPIAHDDLVNGRILLAWFDV